jgi:hypothetical protein
MRMLLCLSACVLLVGCSQDGNVTIHNYSGPDLEVDLDGATYLLDDGETVTKQVHIGRKFIFGPDDRAVAIRGIGYCKLPFEEIVFVGDGGTVLYTVFGDAGYIDICNETGYTVELYLSWSGDPSWGDPVELVPDGYCTLWMLEEGYWDMLAVTIEGQFEEYNIPISPCMTEAYDLLAPALTKARSTGLKSPGVSAPSDVGGKELRKKHKGTRAGEN